MFKIGEFASINKITIQALRYYDKLNLLKPYHIDCESGYRFYSAKQIPKLDNILLLKSMGFSLKEIAIVLNDNVPLEDILKSKREEVIKEIEESEVRLSRIDKWLNRKSEELMVNYEIAVKEVKDIRVATIRDYITEPARQEHLWEELATYVKGSGAEIMTPCMVVYHRSSRPDMVDAEVIEPINQNIPSTNRVNVKILRGGKAVTIKHMGSYTGLNKAYAYILNHIEEAGYKMLEPIRELYIKGEWNAQSEDDYETELQLFIG